MRHPYILPLLLACSAATVSAQVSIGIELPGVSIGINQPVYPELVPVPGYPVYYAPGAETNYFFYDGMYWVFQGNDWYASTWYNGPWRPVSPDAVPLFVLRVPVSYYRRPPREFMGWRRDEAPRWGEHWGHDWEQRRRGWDHWDRRSAPPRAEVPRYQRDYSGDRYPRDPRQQQVLHNERYHYQPREAVAREHYRQQRDQAPSAPQRGNQEQHRGFDPAPPPRGNQDQHRGFNPGPEAQHPQERPQQGHPAPEPQRPQGPPQQGNPGPERQHPQGHPQQEAQRPPQGNPHQGGGQRPQGQGPMHEEKKGREPG